MSQLFASIPSDRYVYPLWIRHQRQREHLRSRCYVSQGSSPHLLGIPSYLEDQDYQCHYDGDATDDLGDKGGLF